MDILKPGNSLICRWVCRDIFRLINVTYVQHFSLSFTLQLYSIYVKVIVKAWRRMSHV